MKRNKSKEYKKIGMQKINNGQQQQIQFPCTQVQVAKDGIAIITMYSPYHSNTVVLEPKVCNEIVKLWANQAAKSDIAIARGPINDRLA